MFDAQPIVLSLKIASAATLLAFAPGILAARAMSGSAFRGKELCEAFFLLPLVLPPVVTGFALLVLLGRNGLGARLQQISAPILFTPFAAVLASAVVAFPLMYQSAKVAFANVEPLLQDAARGLGATSRRAFWTITVPLARRGILAGVALSFARALGEFGATVMVAGNIAGKTTTAPVAIYFAVEEGHFEIAAIYCALLVAGNLVFIVALQALLRRKE